MTHPDDVGRGGVAPARLVIGLADLAQEVVAEVAPGQLPYLALVTAEWAAGRDPRKPAGAWTGGEIGLGGTDPSVLSDIIYPLLTGTAAQVLGAAGFAGLQRRRWWRRRRRATTPTQLALDVDRIDEVRDACLVHGQTLGLNEAEAALLADAVEAALRRAVRGERP